MDCKVCGYLKIRIIPLLVPKAIVAEAHIQVGVPKERFPASEKSCEVMVFSLVQRITSQGALLSSRVSKGASSGLTEPWEEFRE